MLCMFLSYDNFTKSSKRLLIYMLYTYIYLVFIYITKCHSGKGRLGVPILTALDP